MLSPWNPEMGTKGTCICKHSSLRQLATKHVVKHTVHYSARRILGTLMKDHVANVDILSQCQVPSVDYSSGAKGSGGMDMCADKLMTG